MMRLYNPPYDKDHCTYGFMNGPKDATINRLLECLNISSYPFMAALPPRLWELERLEHLSLARLPQLVVFPDMSLLGRVKTLVLEGMAGLVALSAPMASAPGLERLQVKTCRNLRAVETGFVDALREREGFCFLHLGDCPVALNPAMAQLRHLQGLHIHTVCELTRSVFELGALRAMTSLHLADMEFVQELPESMWEMAQLRNLALRNMPLRLLSAGVGALARLESLWLEELTIRSVPADLGQLTELKEFNMQLCIFCRSLLVAALVGMVGLLYMQIEWCKCPDEFGAWYLDEGYSSRDTEGVAVFWQLCAALPHMRALQTLTLRELRLPADLDAVAQALRSPPPALRCV